MTNSDSAQLKQPLTDPSSEVLVSDAGKIEWIDLTAAIDANALIAQLPEGCIFPRLSTAHFTNSNITFASFVKLSQKCPNLISVSFQHCASLNDCHTSSVDFTLSLLTRISLLECNLGGNLPILLNITPSLVELWLCSSLFDVNPKPIKVCLAKIKILHCNSEVDAMLLADVLSGAIELDDLDLYNAKFIGNFAPRVAFPLRSLKSFMARGSNTNIGFLLAIITNAHSLISCCLLECSNLALSPEQQNAIPVPPKFDLPNLLYIWSGKNLPAVIINALLRGTPNLMELNMIGWEGNPDELKVANDVSLPHLTLIECRTSTLKSEHIIKFLDKAPNTHLVLPATKFTRTEIARAWLAASRVLIHGRDESLKKIVGDDHHEYHSAYPKEKLLLYFFRNIDDLLNEVVALKLFFEQEATNEERARVFSAIQSHWLRMILAAIDPNVSNLLLKEPTATTLPFPNHKYDIKLISQQLPEIFLPRIMLFVNDSKIPVKHLKGKDGVGINQFMLQAFTDALSYVVALRTFNFILAKLREDPNVTANDSAQELLCSKDRKKDLFSRTFLPGFSRHFAQHGQFPVTTGANLRPQVKRAIDQFAAGSQTDPELEELFSQATSPFARLHV